MLGIDGRADGLQGEENQHSDAGGDEQEAAAETITVETSSDGDGAVENLEDTVDQVLDADVGDADGLEDSVQVI